MKIIIESLVLWVEKGGQNAKKGKYTVFVLLYALIIWMEDLFFFLRPMKRGFSYEICIIGQCTAIGSNVNFITN